MYFLLKNLSNIQDYCKMINFLLDKKVKTMCANVCIMKFSTKKTLVIQKPNIPI